MSTKLILAIAASLLLATHVAAQVLGETPQKLNAILCDTEEQAIQLASSQASGQTEPMAINLVNKAAGAEVCGRYIGYAVVERTAACSCSPAFAFPKTAGSAGRSVGSRPSTPQASRAGRKQRRAVLHAD